MIAFALALGEPQDAPPPFIAVEPGTLDFGEQVVGEASKSRRLTVTNGGQSQLYVNSVTITGENADDYALGGDACTDTTLAPGKSCVLDVVVTPSGVDARSATLTITGNGGDSVQTVALTSTGINSVEVPPALTALSKGPIRGALRPGGRRAARSS